MLYNKTKSQFKKAKYIYGDYYGKCSKVLSELVHFYSKEKGYKIAMWGGGLKGMVFLDLIDKDKEYINYVFDIDKSKFNLQLPTGHIIVDYKSDKYHDTDVVLIMSNNFETEIAGMLNEIGMKALLVNIDSVICGDLSKEEALDLYNRRLI